MTKSAKLGRGFSYLAGISYLQGEIEREPFLSECGRSPRIAKKIGITSGKGGTGKSILTCNLSICLAGMEKTVTILDADFGLANDHILFGLHPDRNIAHILRGGHDIEDIRVKCLEGVWLIPGTSGLEWTADLNDAHLYKIVRALEEQERAADFILIDTSAGIARQTLLLLLCCDEIVVVTTASATAMTDAYAISKALFRLKPSARIWIAVNRVRDARESLAVFQKMDQVSRKFRQKEFLYLGYLREDEMINTCVNLKTPVVMKYPLSAASREIAGMGRTIASEGDPFNGERETDFMYRRIRTIMPDIRI